MRPKNLEYMNLGNSTRITTVQDKEIVLTGSDGHTFKMKIADLAEAVRQVMPVATNIANGLMDKTVFSMIDSRLNPFKGTNNATDINQLFKECDAGLTMYNLISAAINSPGAGFLLHFQRLNKGDLSSSQIVYQLAMLSTRSMQYRYGTPSATDMSYSNWIVL